MFALFDILQSDLITLKNNIADGLFVNQHKIKCLGHNLNVKQQQTKRFEWFWYQVKEEIKCYQSIQEMHNLMQLVQNYVEFKTIYEFMVKKQIPQEILLQGNKYKASNQTIMTTFVQG